MGEPTHGVVCEHITVLRMIAKRPFEDWEIQFVNAAMPMFQKVWSNVTSKGEAMSCNLIASMSSLFDYMDIWSPTELFKLNDPAVDAFLDLAQVVDQHELARVSILAQLYSFLACKR